jgi:hypothetical protein
MAPGFDAIKDKFRHMCMYAAHSSGNALCNYQSGSDSHYWATAGKVGLGYMCGKVEDTAFQVQLQGKNGVRATKWEMLVAKVAPKYVVANDFSATMRNTCTALGSGWKPICDHPNYCKADSNAAYLGQDHHTAHVPHRNALGYWPTGWSAANAKFPQSRKVCFYTAHHGGNQQTLCGHSGGSHEWIQASASANRNIGCARAIHVAPGRCDIQMSGARRWSGWINNWDGSHDNQCSSNELMNGLYSVHHNGVEDRRMQMSCQPFNTNNVALSSTWYYGWTNWDATYDFKCPNGYAIVGYASFHHNGVEDRRFRWKCRNFNHASQHVMSSPTRTGWANNWDGTLNWHTGGNDVLVGIFSTHNNGYEDRLFGFYYTRISTARPSC